MRALTAFAVGLGIGLSGGAVYMLISNKQGRHTDKEQKPAYLEKRHTGPQTQHGKPRQEQVEDLENCFFRGIEKILNLNEKHITDLKTVLKMSRDDNEDQFENCQTLQDILITAGRYRLITAILTKAGIDARPITWHIDQLSEQVKAITNGFVTTGFKEDPFDYDAVIFYCEENRDMVKTFISDVTNPSIPNLSLPLFEEFDITQPALQSMAKLLSYARYVYVFVTHELTSNNLDRFNAGIVLTESLQEKNWRVVPIWATKSNKHIPELNQITGLKYWQFLDQSNKEGFLKVFSQHILEGRKSIFK